MWQGGKGEEAEWELRGSSPWTQLSVRREKGFLVGGDKTTKPHFKANLNFIPDEKNRQYQCIHPLYTDFEYLRNNKVGDKNTTQMKICNLIQGSK